MQKGKINNYEKIFLIVLSIFALSCETENKTEEAISHKMQFKFYSATKSTSRDNQDFFLLESTIIQNGTTLSLISDELEMSRTVNQETGLESYIIHKKETNNENQKPGGPSIEFGYFYNGGDCWIAGTWYHGDNGVDLFVPGSAATQYLMNICGWGNVA